MDYADRAIPVNERALPAPSFDHNDEFARLGPEAHLLQEPPQPHHGPTPVAADVVGGLL